MKNNYNEEMQDILDNIPTRYFTKVLILILSFFLTILLLAIFIRKPDTVKATVKIVSNPAPVTLKSERNGYLNLLVKDRDSVSVGSYLAYINGDYNLEQILKLEKFLIRDNIRSSNIYTLDFSSLGDLRRFYVDYLMSYKTLLNYIKLNNYDAEIKFLASSSSTLEDDLKLYELSDQTMSEKKRLYTQQFQADSILYNDRLLRSEAYRQSKISFENVNLDDNTYRIKRKGVFREINQISDKQKLLRHNRDKQLSDLKLALISSKNSLLNEIDAWKKNNIIIAPINGRVEISTLTRNKNYVFTGQSLVTIFPNDRSLFAQAVIPSHRYGKIKSGQKVDIKLLGYPYFEYGSLKGTLTDKSFISQDTSYFAHIKLDNGLFTSNNIKLDFIHNMSGTADIIVSERTVLDRIFEKIYTLFY